MLTPAIFLTAALFLPSTRGAHAQWRAAGTDPLSPGQIDNLVLLGKVWGFAKYHDPRITAGTLDWDAQLSRVLRAVLAADTRASASSVIASWLGDLGPIPPCQPCAVLPADVHVRSNVDWIRDQHALGSELSRQLIGVYENRRADSAQYYVSFVPHVGNPVFRNEQNYNDATSPGAELRLLALYRFWNIIEYWFPYRDLIEEDWDGVLREFVPRLWHAQTPNAYRLELMALIARVHDTHANLWNALSVRPPVGLNRVPVLIRFIEGKAVVSGYTHSVLGPASGLRPGDVIMSIDDQRVDSLVAAWTPYYAASNQAALLRDVGRMLTQGPAGKVELRVQRDGRAFNVQTERVDATLLDRRAALSNDLPGDAFQMLSDDVAYLKLSAVSAAAAVDYITRAAGAKVFVIDIRNYPREFMVFALGQHLVFKQTDFARFTIPDAANPGTFTWTPAVSLRPMTPSFGGTVVILVDETSQSQAEYTAMAFRSAPNALVAGSTTAGADGNVSTIPLPGGLRSMISGIGVFYPDRKPTQRVGIVPDLVVRPTIKGIREGRDEVLEAAVTKALGRQFRLARQ